ncbi:hypothetical protein B5X24_HaOG200872 [Helicoverpa armigera]|uniref:Uncharacterized protein n=1 Tax=Helicoverpa armigera TaxID=29058 RepID=A0A2W1BCZ3_HELAM|nr:hypothetical protein B5X24_HaOG200872 [Helicoverpa armigera]
MVFRLLCGFYFKISSNKIITVLVRAYCLFIGATIVLGTIVYISQLEAILISILNVTNIINVVTDCFFYGENFTAFLQKITKLDISGDLEGQIDTPVTMFILLFTLFVRLCNHIRYLIIIRVYFSVEFCFGIGSTALCFYHTKNNDVRATVAPDEKTP